MSHEDYMRAAVRIAEAGIAAGQTPFGCAIVRDGAVVAEAHNTVWQNGMKLRRKVWATMTFGARPEVCDAPPLRGGPASTRQ